MAVLFSKPHHQTGAPCWAAVELDAGVGAYALTGDPEQPVRTIGDLAAVDWQRSVCLLHHAAGQKERWVLLAGRSVPLSLNGLSQDCIRVLRDRDKLRLRDADMRFSSEVPLRVVPMPDLGRAIQCARCGQPVEAGTDSVRCACGAYFHQQADTLPCYAFPTETGTAACPLCGRPTTLEDGGLRWVPNA